jgi:carboxymethylenebutenolidase
VHDHLDAAGGIRGDLQFHYAEHDDHIPLEAVEHVRTATARPGHELHVYPGTAHGFNCWARAAYDPGAAALAFGRSLTFLAQRLF